MHVKVFFLLIIAVSALTEAKQDIDGNSKGIPTKRRCKPKDHETSKYSKESNENFDKNEDEDCLEQDEIIDENEEMQQKQDDKKKPTIKSDSRGDKTSKDGATVEKDVEIPKIPEDILEGGFSIESMFQDLMNTIGNTYDESFNAALKMVAEMETNMKNLTTEVTKKVDKLSTEKGKDLSKVNEIIKSAVKDAKKEFKAYSETITENQVTVNKAIHDVFSKKTTPSNDVDILKETHGTFGKLEIIGDKATVFLNSIPNKIDEITSKTNEYVKDELTKLENELDMELGDIIIYFDENISNYNTNLAEAINNSTAGLTVALKTIVSLFGLIGGAFQ